IGSFLMPDTAPGGDAPSGGGAGDAWDAQSGATHAWSSSEGFDDRDDAQAWGAYTRENHGAADTWSASGPEHEGPEAWNTGHSYGEGGGVWGSPGSGDPGPSTAAFGSVGRPDADEFQYGAAH